MGAAALVLGIIGTLFSLNWLTVWVGGPMAIIALVLGILARKNLAAEGKPTGNRETGIGLQTDDIDALYGDLKANGVDVDDEVSRMGDPVPPLFWLRDPEGNTLMVVQ